MFNYLHCGYTALGIIWAAKHHASKGSSVMQEVQNDNY